MNAKKQSIDMLHGPFLKKLLLFAFPIALSSILQQLFHAADTSVVGHFASAEALAAVGTNGEIVALLVSLSSGFAIGANVLIAKCIGAKKHSAISDILHTSIFLALTVGVAGAILGQLIARPLLHVIQTPANILDQAVTYLRIYFWGYPFLLLYDFGSAILRSKGDSKRPFFALIISGLINVLLNVLLVIVCRLGVAGVAIATDISNAICAGLVLRWLQKEPEEFHFSIRKIRIHPEYLYSMLFIGIPAAIQGAVFCFANIFVQSAVNSFGSIAVAGSTIAMNFEYFGYYMITACGQAATTFTSQNFAARQIKNCKKILFLCLILSVIFSSLITVPLTIFRYQASGIFSADSLVIDSACVRIMLILIFEPICSFYEIPAGVLRGTGHSALPAVLTIIGTCLFRIVWIFTIFRQYHTQNILFAAFPLSWICTILLMFAAFLMVNSFHKNM